MANGVAPKGLFALKDAVTDTQKGSGRLNVRGDRTDRGGCSRERLQVARPAQHWAVGLVVSSSQHAFPPPLWGADLHLECEEWKLGLR